MVMKRGIDVGTFGNDVLAHVSSQPSETFSKEPLERRAYALLKIVAWAYRHRLSYVDLIDVADALGVNDQEARTFAAERLCERAQAVYGTDLKIDVNGTRTG